MVNRHPLPIIIHSDENRQVLTRISLENPPFKEEGLQKLLQLHPEILPVGKLDERFDPLFCIGRETDLGKGCYLDNLFISPGGYITLVETKLWKNPEARREVVGQIIEYAKQLSEWTYDDVDRACKAYTRKYESSEKNLIDLVSYQSGREFDENTQREFVDTVNRTLRDGQFKLLVVGEGIRESVEEMVEYLHSTPSLRFGLALVELACYKMDKEEEYPYLIVPRIIVKTKEVERAVVTIQMSDEAKEKVEIDVTTPKLPAKPGQGRARLEEEDFYRQLSETVGQKNVDTVRNFVGDVVEGLEIEEYLQVATLSLKIRNPKDPDIMLTAIDFGVNGKIGRGGGLYSRIVKKWGFSPSPIEEFVKAMNKIHSGFHLKKAPRGDYAWPTVNLIEVIDRLPEIKLIIQGLIDQLQSEYEKEGN